MTAVDVGTRKGDPALDKFLAELCQALAAAEAGEEGVRLSTRRATSP